MTSKKVPVSLAGSPAFYKNAASCRSRDPRGDRYDRSQAFDPRTNLSRALRRKGPVSTEAV